MGLILPQEVEIELNSRNVTRYKNLGYNIPYRLDRYKHKKYDIPNKIFVNVLDLSVGSHTYVKVLCDHCKKEYSMQYKHYINAMKSTVKKTICQNCSIYKTWESKKHIYDNEYYCNSQKAQETIKEKYNGSVMNDENVIKKYKETCEKKYGVPYAIQSKEVRLKINDSFYKNGTKCISKQQNYINNLYNGELNYPCSYYLLDIAFNEDMIDCEIDFGGHNLRVKCGNITQEEFNKKEIIRDSIVKSNGYKIMRIISRKDYLPSDEILLQILEISKDYFNTTEHTWISWDIDESKYFNAEHQDGVLFNFGKLRKLPRKTKSA